MKGERCFGQKCAMIRRPFAPGVHGKNRRRQLSEYGRQLAEKQKVRFAYGVSEKQLKNYFSKVSGRKGNKGEHLLMELEKRLDNVVFRLGWASSRRLARQTVSHGHITVNGRRVDIPSYRVKKDDLIRVKAGSQEKDYFKNIKTFIKKYGAPGWLILDKEKMEGKIIDEPKVEEVGKIGEWGMIVEYYSR